MSPAGSGDIFDLKKLRRLIELMQEHDLSEVDLAQGDERVRLCRRDDSIVTTPAAPAQPTTSPPPPAPTEGGSISLIKSPMVGTFYLASSPESPPYVRVGDHVGPETTVCIVEAMKVFNEIPAETSGKVVAILVENGDPVEYGQPLFKVDASA